MNTTTALFLRSDPAMYTSPGRTYARVGVRDPARMYVRGRIYILAPWSLYVHVHATCVPLLRHVRASTSTSMYVHIRDQNDNATYASTRWVPAIREDKEALPCVQRCSWWVPAVRGNVFFAKYGGPSGGSLLSGGGIILHVIRRHFLAVAVDPAVSLSTYSTLLMEVVP